MTMSLSTNFHSVTQSFLGVSVPEGLFLVSTFQESIGDNSTSALLSQGLASNSSLPSLYHGTSVSNVTDWLCDPNNSRKWKLQTSVCSTMYHSLAAFVAVALLLSSITLWTVLGNVLVLVALCKYDTLRTMSNCLIGNLAFSDLLLALTVLPISTTNDLLGYWVFGELTCTLWLCMDVLYCTASIWGLCTVAFDRYMATVFPVWYHDQRSVRKAVACVVFVWIFSIVISLAPFIGWQHMIPNFFTFNTETQRYECVLFTSSSYVIYSAMGSFVLPLALMAFMYIRIFIALHDRSKALKSKAKSRASTPSSPYNGSLCQQEPEERLHNGVTRDTTTTTLISAAGEPDTADRLAGRDPLNHLPRILEPQPLHEIADINGQAPTANSHVTLCTRLHTHLQREQVEDDVDTASTQVRLCRQVHTHLQQECEHCAEDEVDTVTSLITSCRQEHTDLPQGNVYRVEGNIDPAHTHKPSRKDNDVHASHFISHAHLQGNSVMTHTHEHKHKDEHEQLRIEDGTLSNEQIASSRAPPIRVSAASSLDAKPEYTPSPAPSTSSSSRRSNSFALPNDDNWETQPSGVKTTPFLDVAVLDRRKSHLGSPIRRSVSEITSVHTLSPACNRSQSTNALSSVVTDSEDEAGVFLHVPRVVQQRRSLPCNMPRMYRRTHRMTLSMKRRFELREQRATKRMLLIMACFCVCWVPFLVMYVTRSICVTCSMSQHFVAAIIWLGYVNSSLNPVLYTLFNDDFKNAFKKLVGMKRRVARRRQRYRS